MCHTCKGTAEIQRPTQRMIKLVERPYRTRYGVERETKPEVSIVGGTDACPTCMRRAEIEYQVWKA